MARQKCPVCQERPPKRACPALGQQICPVCCATKREVEVRCPADCGYLSASRAHPPAVVQRRQERDLGYLLPLVADLTETQYRLVVLFQSITSKHADQAVPPLIDADVAEAAAATAATLETAGKGIIYQHQAVSVPAQRLADELAGAVSGLVAQNQPHQSRIERDSAVALRKLEAGARGAAQVLAGDEAPVYLRMLQRIFAGAAPDREGPPPAPSLIVAP